MRNRFQQFMYGRYGMDQLNRFLSTIALIILVVSMFIRRPIVEIVALALLFWCYYRMFSKNISKRAAENQKYMNFRYRAVCFFKKGRTGGSASFAQKQAQRKAHHEQKKMYRFFCMSELCAEGASAERKRKNLYYLSEMPYRVCKEKLEKSLKSNVGIQMAKCLKKKLDKMRKEK